MPLFRRPDGDLARDVPLYRRMLQLFGGRTSSSVLFDQHIEVGAALAWVRRYNETHARRITLFHLVLHAIVRALAERPRLNRFTSGGRVYQRRGIWISYSAKKAMNDDAPVVAIKRQFDPAWSFDRLVEEVSGSVDEGRSDRPSVSDKELRLLFLFPLVVIRIVFWALRKLDAWNLLPASFIRNDPFFASIYVSNMGSLKMEACHHHLWDYGTIPIFAAIGQAHTVEGRQIMTIKYTFDERIEDGLYCARALDLVRARLEAPDESAGVAAQGGGSDLASL
jgi:hypothetical protein